MFLNQLSAQEKKMFLDLSVYVAKANNELAIEEKAMISEYCNEMQLPHIELFESEPLETVLDYFSFADMHIKKIVLLEIYGLSYVDGSFDINEMKIVNDYIAATGISEKDAKDIRDAIDDYYALCNKMGEVVK